MLAEDRRLRLTFFSLLATAYFGAFPYLHAVNNPNENVRTYMTMAMVEQGTFRIDAIVARHGWVNDMAKATDAKTGLAHLYSVKAPAVSYAGVPIYWAFRHIAPRLGLPMPTLGSTGEVKAAWLRQATWILRIFSVQLPCFAFLLWFERFLRRFSRDAALRLLTVAAVGVGTNYLAYALMFVSHALFAVAAFLSFAVLVAQQRQLSHQRQTHSAFAAGLTAGWCTLLEYHALPVSVILGCGAVAIFWRPKLLVAYGLGAALPMAALLFFQWRAFGDPFMPGHRMCENPAFATMLQQGYFGLGTPDLKVLAGISFNPTFGFFSTSPFCLFGLIALPWIYIKRRHLRFGIGLLATVAAVLWLTVSAATNWRGGWTIGPRYLGAAPPFFAFMALLVLDALIRRHPRRRSWLVGIAAGLVLIGFAHVGFPSLHYNTMPEEVLRPTFEVSWPMARRGFVPHQLLEWIGYSSPWIWWAITAAALTCILLPLWQKSLRATLAQLAIAMLVALAALAWPMSTSPSIASDNVRQQFEEIWEPRP